MGKGYFVEWLKVSEETRNYLVSLVLNESIHTQYLFLHLIAGTLLFYKRVINRQGEVWIPVSAELIRKNARSASWKRLQELELVDVKEYSLKQGKSREFLVSKQVIERVMELIPAKLEDCKRMVNLIDGRDSKAKLKSIMTNESRNSEPDLIKQAVSEIRGCLFRLRALERYVDGLRRKWERSGSESDKSRYVNDLMCLQVLYQHNPVVVNEALDLWSYDPSYRAQVSGRISHRGGGLQTCSRSMKSVAYSSIDNVFNYDLKASQVNGLLQQFEEFGVNTDWLKKYLVSESGKDEYAKRIGISVDTWKSCLYAVFMGGGGSEGGAVFHYLVEECNDDMELAAEKLNLFLSEVKELRVGIKQWHKKLWDHAMKKSKRVPFGGRYWTNPTGKSVCLDELEYEYGGGALRKLAAFVLQGQEAAFIHYLTILSKEYGYRVVANEHDGLVTEGCIPTEAVNKAAELSGMKYARLEEKKLEPLPEELLG